MSRFRLVFNPQVDVMLLLTLLGFLITGAVAWTNVKGDVAQLNKTQTVHGTDIDSIKTELAKQEIASTSTTAAIVVQKSDLDKLERRLGATELKLEAIPTILERLDWIIKAQERSERRAGYQPPPLPPPAPNP